MSKTLIFITASLFLFGCGVEKTLTTDNLTTDILTTNNYTLDKLIVTQIKIQPRQKKVNIRSIRYVHPIPFYRDIDEDNLEGIQSFIKKERELSIHMRDEDGRNPLRWAVRNSDNPEVVKILIENGADVNAGNEDGETPLYLVVWSDSDNLEIVKILIENGADVNARERWEESLLDIAIEDERRRQGNQYIIDFLKSHEIKASDEPKNIITLLRSHGAKTAAELEAELKAARDAKLKAERTDNKFVHPIPFYRDIDEDNLEGIQSFIKKERELSIHIKDEYENTPLYWAVWSSDNLEVVKILIENGADVNAEGGRDSKYGKDGRETPLDMAIERDRIVGDNQYAIALLRSHGAKTSDELEAELEAARDAQFKAARDAKFKAVQSVVGSEDRPSLKEFMSNTGRSEFVHPIPFYEDINKDNLEEIQSFIKKERELSIHMRDEYKNTPLHWAVWSSDNLEVVKIIIENGADMNIEDRSGETPLDIAIRRERRRHTNQYAIALLKSHGAKTSDELEAELKAARDAKLKAARADKKIVHPIPFYEDISKGNLEEIQFFIKDEQEISVNIKDEYQNTPLHWAVWSSDNLEVVKILIENGADVNAGGGYSRENKYSRDGRETPLDIAIERDRIVGDNQYAIALLRSHGAKTSAELEAE